MGRNVPSSLPDVTGGGRPRRTWLATAVVFSLWVPPDRPVGIWVIHLGMTICTSRGHVMLFATHVFRSTTRVVPPGGCVCPRVGIRRPWPGVHSPVPPCLGCWGFSGCPLSPPALWTHHPLSGLAGNTGSEPTRGPPTALQRLRWGCPGLRPKASSWRSTVQGEVAAYRARVRRACFSAVSASAFSVYGSCDMSSKCARSPLTQGSRR